MVVFWKAILCTGTLGSHLLPAKFKLKLYGLLPILAGNRMEMD
jgi:hypothetical protein